MVDTSVFPDSVLPAGVILDACQRPIRQIIRNADLDPEEIIVSKLK